MSQVGTRSLVAVLAVAALAAVGCALGMRAAFKVL